jgi:DNA-binding transcriptional LysR family regulator
MARSDLSGMEAFLTVAEKGGFSAAARVLGVSASALSQAVSQLEGRIGVPLLTRTTRSVNLTETGRRLFERARPAIREALAAIDEASSARDVARGTLKITLGRIGVPLLIEPLLKPLLSAHPELSLELSIDDRFIDIVESGFDAGIRLSEAISPDLVAVRLTPPFRWVVAGSKKYLERHGRPERPRDLLEHDCIGYRLSSTGGLYAWEFARRGRDESVHVKGRLVCNDGDLMLHAALAGLGLVYHSELLLEPYVERGALELLLEPYAVKVPGFFLYFPKTSRNDPKIRAFIETARRTLSPHSRRSRSYQSMGF